MKNIVAVDLFSGAGGTTAGLKKSGIEVKVAVEIDEIAANTYELNNPEVKVLRKDIKEVTSEEIIKIGDIDENDYLLMVACPPCQGFSSIGLKDRQDVRNQLIFEYERLINEMNPEFILMENVAGMSRGVGMEIFQKFKKNISLNYNIVYSILNAADYGVPQTRKRLVVHGVRKDIYKSMKIRGVDLELPTPTHAKNNSELLPWINAGVILDLPAIEAGEEYKGDGIYNHVSNKLSELNITRIEHIRKNGGSRTSLPEHLTLECHKRSNGHKDVYGILDVSKPSVTMTGGCMSYSKGRFGHPTQNRALSAREAARLQSFEDDYIFTGSKGKLATQIGNAVPVKLAEASGVYFLKLMKLLGA